MNILARIRMGASLYQLNLDFPMLLPGQIALAQRLQALEVELHELYQQIERMESARIEVEHELTQSLLHAVIDPASNKTPALPLARQDGSDSVRRS